MGQQGLRSVVVKKYNHHANRGAILGDKANILKHDFTAKIIDQKWRTGITCTHVPKKRWTYLASVMDLCSRKVTRYVHDISTTAELAAGAVEDARLNVRNAQGVPLHSDLGDQYTSQTFEVYLSSKGMLHPFSCKGNPCDNACIESFHSVSEKEEIYLHTYQGSQKARRAVFEYIEGWHSRKRIHSAIGYMTPQQKGDGELGKSA